MADLVRIGTVAQRTATTRYNLLDKTTAGNIFLLDDGIKPERRDGNLIIMKFRCKSAAGTNSQIQAAEEKIQDHLIDAEKYVKDLHRSSPVFLWFNADGITERKRCIVKGELMPVAYGGTNELLMHDTMFYDLFVWCYPPWEGVTETTKLNGTTMSGITNTVQMTSLLGDVPGRISEFTVRAQNATELAPLYKCWIGIRPEYLSMDDYNPVWNLGYASAQTTDTALSSTDSKVYPYGSTGLNYMACDFDAYTTDVIRTSISMEDVWTNNAAELVINGGGESGNTSGWTSSFLSGTWSASTVNPRTGSYAFRGSEANAASGRLYQEIAATSGLTYYHSIASQFVEWAGTTSSNEALANFVWRTSTGGSISAFGGRYLTDSDGVDGDYVVKEGFAVAPANTSVARISLLVTNNSVPTSGQTIIDVDDVMFKQIYSDDYDGDYLVLLRCKVDSGEVDVYGRYGYEGTSVRPKFGKTQAITHTSWKLVPLGVVSIPPERRITDEEAYWRINKLTFDISAEEISGTPTLDMDALILIPWEHGFYAEDISVCRSSYEIADGELAYADFHVYQTALDEFVIVAEDESFEGVDTNVTWSHNNWKIPAEDCILVAFVQRDNSHQIWENIEVTLNYYPRYVRRYSD